MYKMTKMSILLTIGALILAVFLGIGAGKLVSAQKISSLKDKRSKNTKLLLKKMNTVNVGDKFPNAFFYDLDGNLVELQEIVKTKCVVSFHLSDCHACLYELQLLQRLSKEDQGIPPVIIISSSNPFELITLRDENDLPFPILYDHGKLYANNLNVTSFPFNFVIGSDLVIEAVYPSQLLKEDVLGVLEEIKNETKGL